MGSNIVLALIFLLVALTITMGDDHELVETKGRAPRIRPRSPPPPPPYAPPYDHFKLVLTWPPVYCRVNTCPKPAPKYLTIHGLWPSSSRSFNDPADCDPKSPVTMGQWKVILETSENNLNNFWPSLTSQVNKEFWGNEWLKHGTCSKELFGAIKYFDVTLKHYVNYKLQYMLQNTQLLAKPSAPKQDIVQAIHDIINANPQIRCEKIGQLEYLTEVRLCFTATKTPQLMNCSGSFKNCSEKDVHF